jgi:hypothetical protein
MHSKFDVAESLAKAACHLDGAKLAWPDVDQARTLELSERMYDMADELAGDRKEELYTKMGIAASKCSGGPGWAAL